MPSSPLERLLAELKRRRVFRVAGAYLVAAFVVLQVADLVQEPLHLPAWTLTLLIVLLTLGLLLAVALAWAFDVTPDGIRRADAAGAAGATGDAPRTRRRRRPRVALAAAVVGLALLGPAGWWTWTAAHADAIELDPGLVAVLPFRVAGADPGVAYLGEGVMDLLAARFRTDDALRVAPARDVVRALGAAPDSPGDPDFDAAEATARAVGAGAVLLGEVVGDAGHLTLTATLLDAGSGEVRARVMVPGSADSLHALVDGLAGQLLAATAGTPTERLADITTRSLPALRAYLDGTRAFRAGRPTEAAGAFDRALGEDSTFVLAALGLLQATLWATFVDAENEALASRLAWRERGRLAPADRLYLTAILGRDYPASTPRRARLEDLLDATTRLPEVPELWYLLGDEYYHEGRLLGFDDAVDRAERNFERAVAMDSLYVEPWLHIFDIAAFRGDTATARLATEQLEAVDANSEETLRNRFFLSRMGVPMADAPALDTLPPRILADLATASRWTGVAAHELGDALERARRDEEVSANLLWGASFQLAGRRGRIEEIRDLLDRGVQEPYWPGVNRLVVEMYVATDTARMRDAVDRWRSRAPAPDADPSSALMGDCLVEHWKLGRGDTTTARATIARHRAAAQDTAYGRYRPTFELCARTLTALRDHVVGSDSAEASIAAVERFTHEGIYADVIYREIVALTMARILDERGQPARALSASRRTVTPGYFLATRLRLEEARLAEEIGERETALTAYRDYLHWYRDAQGPLRDQVRAVRDHVAELVGER